MERRIIILTIVIAGLIGVNGYFLIVRAQIRVPDSGPVFSTTEAYIMPPVQANYLPILNATAGQPTLDAKAAIVYDVKADRNLYEKNINEKLPIASLTKILNAIVVWENLSPNDIVTVGPTAVKVDGERQDLYVGETISVNNLMQMMLIESSNDAAYALRDYAATKGIDLVAAMNAKATTLGMINTHFVDAAGLDDNGYSTVQDLVKAVHYALQYSALWDFSREQTAVVSSTDGKFSQDMKSTDDLLGVINNIIGGKTGYTDGALGCMMLIVTAPAQDDTMIGVVLGSNDRFGDMNTLITWTQNAYRWQ